MHKKISLGILNLALLFGALSAAPTKQTIKTHAFTHVNPTDGPIDVSHLNDTEVNAYYDGSRGKADVNGLSGESLLAALYDNIKDHNEYNYDNLGPIYKITDRNEDLSPLTPDLQAHYKFTHNTGANDDNPYLVKLYADYNDDANTADRYRNEEGGKVTFDKEHIWAQSLGQYGRARGAGSDLHALWPSDRKGNQQAHSNYNYAAPTLDRKAYENDKGTIVGYNGKIDGYNHKVFEPLDEFKGDIARAMFYMPARYFEYIDEEHPKLALTNGSPTDVIASPSQPGFAGDLQTLLEWHEEDPVSEFEIRRNNLLYKNFQLNRNPFIDHPEWARIAYDSNYAGPGASTAAETSSVGANSDPFRSLDLTHIVINAENIKKTYFQNEVFSLVGLGVRAFYSDGSSKVIRNFTSSLNTGDVLTVPGESTVTISYKHTKYLTAETTLEQTKTATFKINVKNVTLRDVLFISEVYGGGGNSGAPLKSDFIELYNHSDEPINLSGKSLQHSATGGSNNYKVIKLEGTIEPQSFFLVHFYTAGNPVGVDLPLVDLHAHRNMAQADLYVALMNTATPFDNDTIPLVNGKQNVDAIPELIDFFGGGNATIALGTKQTGGSATKSYQRKFANGAPIDTRNNSEDFVANTPTPMNSALSVAMKILVGNEEDQCLDRYYPTKELVLRLSDDVYEENENGIVKVGDGQLTYFQTGSYDIMPAGRARYEAWAVALGDTHPYELIAEQNHDQPTNIIINTPEGYIVVIFMTIAVFGGYFVLRRKEERN